MPATVMNRGLDGSDKGDTIMVVTVSAGLLLIVFGIIFYVMYIAGPRRARVNNGNANNARNRAANNANVNGNGNGAEGHETDSSAETDQGYAVEYLRFILQRARANIEMEWGVNQPENTENQQNASGNGQNANDQQNNAAGNGQNTAAQGNNQQHSAGDNGQDTSSQSDSASIGQVRTEAATAA